MRNFTATRAIGGHIPLDIQDAATCVRLLFSDHEAIRLRDSLWAALEGTAVPGPAGENVVVMGTQDQVRKNRVDVYITRVKAEREREAENRRKLLAELDPKTREFAIREFAKLGLTQ